jgi:hypothetical protein
MLWIAGGADAGPQRRSSEHFGADLVVVEGEGHNLMMEAGWYHTARTVHDWLSDHCVS